MQFSWQIDISTLERWILLIPSSSPLLSWENIRNSDVISHKRNCLEYSSFRWYDTARRTLSQTARYDYAKFHFAEMKISIISRMLIDTAWATCGFIRLFMDQANATRRLQENEGCKVTANECLMNLEPDSVHAQHPRSNVVSYTRISTCFAPHRHVKRFRSTEVFRNFVRYSLRDVYGNPVLSSPRPRSRPFGKGLSKPCAHINSQIFTEHVEQMILHNITERLPYYSHVNNANITERCTYRLSIT